MVTSVDARVSFLVRTLITSLPLPSLTAYYGPYAGEAWGRTFYDHVGEKSYIDGDSGQVVSLREYSFNTSLMKEMRDLLPLVGRAN